MDHYTGDFCNPIGGCPCWNREFITDIVMIEQYDTFITSNREYYPEIFNHYC